MTYPFPPDLEKLAKDLFDIFSRLDGPVQLRGPAVGFPSPFGAQTWVL